MSRVKDLILPIKIMAGTSIEDAVKQAHYFARFHGVVVEFNFNGKYMVVGEGTVIENECAAYHEWLKDHQENDVEGATKRTIFPEVLPHSKNINSWIDGALRDYKRLRVWLASRGVTEWEDLVSAVIDEASKIEKKKTELVPGFIHELKPGDKIVVSYSEKRTEIIESIQRSWRGFFAGEMGECVVAGGDPQFHVFRQVDACAPTVFVEGNQEAVK